MKTAVAVESYLKQTSKLVNKKQLEVDLLKHFRLTSHGSLEGVGGLKTSEAYHSKADALVITEMLFFNLPTPFFGNVGFVKFGTFSALLALPVMIREGCKFLRAFVKSLLFFASHRCGVRSLTLSRLAKVKKRQSIYKFTQKMCHFYCAEGHENVVLRTRIGGL